MSRVQLTANKIVMIIKLLKLIIHRGGWSLQFVRNQTDELCLEAIKNNINASKYVINMCDELKYMIHHTFGTKKDDLNWN